MEQTIRDIIMQADDEGNLDLIYYVSEILNEFASTQKRTYCKDRYNDNKVWEVAKLKVGYYLRQYVCREQFGKGLRTTKKYIQSLGLFQREPSQIYCSENQKEILQSHSSAALPSIHYCYMA